MEQIVLIEKVASLDLTLEWVRYAACGKYL